ncbi:MTH1187 family thiamine-binding protein [Endothiovibrio diazotrophicus]
MKVIAGLSLVPLGTPLSLSPYVAAVEDLLAERGLTFTLHATGTDIEGEWDEVMDAVKAAHQKIHDLGAPRIQTHLSLSTRTDRAQTMNDRIESVAAKRT